MNAKLGFLSLLAGIALFLAPMPAQAVGSDRPPFQPPAGAPDSPTGPILSSQESPAPSNDSQDASPDPVAPAPAVYPEPAPVTPTGQRTHYSMDDLARSIQSLEAPADPSHYTMDDIANGTL